MTIFDQPHAVVGSQLVTHPYTDAKGKLRTVTYTVEIWRVNSNNKGA